MKYFVYCYKFIRRVSTIKGKDNKWIQIVEIRILNKDNHEYMNKKYKFIFKVCKVIGLGKWTIT